jgi:uncharacterized protein
MAGRRDPAGAGLVHDQRRCRGLARAGPAQGALPALAAGHADGPGRAPAAGRLGGALPSPPLSLLSLAGLRKPIVAPLAWAAIVLVPAWLACALWIESLPPVRSIDLLWQGLAGPFAEELIYRGLAIGLLTTLCGWRWLPACLAPALLFGLAHLGQGADPASIAGIALITAAGGLLFGWLWVRWDGNLWPPVLLHAGMNSLWLLYGLGENAIGGLPGNVLRAGIVVAAVGLTWLYVRRARPAGSTGR